MTVYKCPQCFRTRELEGDYVMVICPSCQIEMVKIRNILKEKWNQSQ
jgi:DNA-directed RNA polymerase subunit RPC12/RpoP